MFAGRFLFVLLFGGGGGGAHICTFVMFSCTCANFVYFVYWFVVNIFKVLTY